MKKIFLTAEKQPKQELAKAKVVAFHVNSNPSIRSNPFMKFNRTSKVLLFFLGLFVLPGVFSCTPKNANLQNSKSKTLLTYEKERTRGDRSPRYSIEVLNNGYVKYNGHANVLFLGERMFKLEKKEFNRIIKAFENTNFDQFEPTYKGGMRDLPLTSITFQGHKVSFRKENSPEKLEQLSELIENTSFYKSWLGPTH